MASTGYDSGYQQRKDAIAALADKQDAENMALRYARDAEQVAFNQAGVDEINASMNAPGRKLPGEL